MNVQRGLLKADESKHSKMEPVYKVIKKLLKESPEVAKDLIRRIIKNTYRTLMTRGIKGCYIWAVDEETRGWLKQLT